MQRVLYGQSKKGSRISGPVPIMQQLSARGTLGVSMAISSWYSLPWCPGWFLHVEMAWCIGKLSVQWMQVAAQAEKVRIWVSVQEDLNWSANFHHHGSSILTHRMAHSSPVTCLSPPGRVLGLMCTEHILWAPQRVRTVNRQTKGNPESAPLWSFWSKNRGQDLTPISEALAKGFQVPIRITSQA